ncbi:MAG: hypothetical protein FD174_2714 [Geobacteraceae bacterium]|nr:MAG: hypothetical protein FD174_2714 [Geobacteraceae bacterium]
MLKALFPGVEHLQNVHPLFVHFPIAFLAGASLFYLLAWRFRKESLATTAFSLLVLGALASAAAAGTGLYAEPGVMVSRSVRTRLLQEHKELMLWTSGLSIVLALWAASFRPFPQKGRPLFLLMLLVLLAVMSLGVDYGARMVYDYNAGGSACPQPIEFSR